MVVYANIFFIGIVGLIAGTLGGVIGTGSSVILLPILVWNFGPKTAVPIMAIAAVLANVGRVAAWRREINWKAFAAYSITSVPAAALGARTLLELPAGFIDILLGTFFMGMVPLRRWLKGQQFQVRLYHLSIAGLIIGFLTGIVVSVGPISVATFSLFGLQKGILLGTEAMTSLLVYSSKTTTFQLFGALPIEVIFEGVLVGLMLIIGAYAGKYIVNRLHTRSYEKIIEFTLIFSGLFMFILQL